MTDPSARQAAFADLQHGMAAMTGDMKSEFSAADSDAAFAGCFRRSADRLRALAELCDRAAATYLAEGGS